MLNLIGIRRVTMKIIIERFGPIKRFEYDLSKDIVITYGANNIGKSYSMQLVYLMLKNILETYESKIYYHAKYNNFTRQSFSDIEKLINEFAASDALEKDLSEFINNQALKILEKDFIYDFSNSCLNTFGNFGEIINNEPLITLILNNNNKLIVNLHNSSIMGYIVYRKVVLKKTKSDFHKAKTVEGKYTIYYYNDSSTPYNLIMNEIGTEIISFISKIRAELGSLYFLPASRSGIYNGMNSLGSFIAELSRNKAMLTRKIEFQGVSEPISDYYLMVTNIRLRESEILAPVYKGIEEKILGGLISYKPNRNALTYRPNNVDYDFEMTGVSSMVSEISSIVALLKYIIFSEPSIRRARNVVNKAVVFIEEPEAHLHPENQCKLVEMLAELYKYGIKLIMSSHSNYIFNKLNNLVLSKKISQEKYSPIVLINTPEGSVSHYSHIDELGADDENFVDISQKLFEEREEIIKNINFGESEKDSNID
jgi:predicted ATP-dependent endonuclease of OLD family